VAPKTIEVTLNEGGTRVLTGDKVVINVGTHAAMPSIPGLEAARPLTHIETLELEILPPHLIVLGGGYVGLELAQAYRRFGSRVTVIEAGPQLMGREDRDVAGEMQRLLSSEGMEFFVGAEPLMVCKADPEKRSALPCARPSANRRSTAPICSSRRGGPKHCRHRPRRGRRRAGRPRLHSGQRAAGDDCTRGLGARRMRRQPAVHACLRRIIRDNLAGGNRSTHERLVPYCMFTDPPLARVGLSVGEAQRQGVTVRVATLPMSNVLRTEATEETQGFMKVVVGGSDDRILGFTMIGSEAGEVLAAVQMAMLANLAYPKLRDAVIAHLTIAEVLGPLLSSVPPQLCPSGADQVISPLARASVISLAPRSCS
jgi:pyruvate/2-oxoglutarate dehydrogenase complex dihydrolipoamide dehydrogenase (E3) component